MEWVETTGRTVDDAKDAALDELGVAEDDAEFEILEEAKQGLFGRVRVEARVRARVRPAVPRPKEDRRKKGRKGRERGQTTARRGRRGASSASESPDQGADQAADQGERPDRAQETPAGSPAAATVETEADDPRGAAGPPADAPVPAAPRRNPSRRGRGRRRRATTDHAAEGSTTTRHDAGDTKETKVAEETDLRGQAEMAESFLSGLLDAFELEGEVSTTFIDEETFEVRADGDDLGLMIGPKGATLAAVQELTRTAVQRQVTNRTGRILVDVGGYQQRRKEALARFTQQLAEEVVSSGTRKILEPMSAADRKVVHDTCNDIEGVQTVSEGEDPRRRVVIEPAG